mmetsp:Transcript_26136/g.64558  ORF Transcript_26136/g.64558 Transcript_26136/m.64558 type:complete len:205 (+) Transcript_26136:166-780(+)
MHPPGLRMGRDLRHKAPQASAEDRAQDRCRLAHALRPQPPGCAPVRLRQGRHEGKGVCHSPCAQDGTAHPLRHGSVARRQGGLRRLLPRRHRLRVGSLCAAQVPAVMHARRQGRRHHCLSTQRRAHDRGCAVEDYQGQRGDCVCSGLQPRAGAPPRWHSALGSAPPVGAHHGRLHSAGQADSGGEAREGGHADREHYAHDHTGR